MASPGASPDLLTLESVVRGHHIYKEIWTPELDELLSLLDLPQKEFLATFGLDWF